MQRPAKPLTPVRFRIQPPYDMTKEKIINSVESIFEKKDIRIDPLEKIPFSHDWSNLESSEPLVVVFPREEKQIIDVIKLCNSSEQAFIGSGGRTGLSGGATSINHELIISFDKMNKILDFDEEKKIVSCQPGLVTKHLQDFALNNDLFFPIEFSSTGSSQIGGNIATNAGGIRVLRYGLMEKYVEGFEVVGGDGEFYNYDNKLIKNATGPDIKKLFIGSEGIFGLFSKCSIKLIDKPLETNVAILSFNDLSELNKIRNKLNSSGDLEALEFFTKKSSEQLYETNKIFNPLGLNDEYYMIIEFINNSLPKILAELTNDGLINDVVINQNNSQKDQIWKNRMLISESIYNQKPVKFDIAVSVDNFGKLVNEIEEFSANLKVIKPILFGHIGDGNLHANFIIEDDNPNYSEIVQTLNTKIFSIIYDLNGTISAEHGIGYLKRDLYKKFASKKQISLLRSIKHSFDPNSLLNPNKLI